MKEALIIICCEIIMGTGNNPSYSYEAGYTSNHKYYTITMFTARKYEVGDTVSMLNPYGKIDWSDTAYLKNN